MHYIRQSLLPAKNNKTMTFLPLLRNFATQSGLKSRLFSVVNPSPFLSQIRFLNSKSYKLKPNSVSIAPLNSLTFNRVINYVFGHQSLRNRTLLREYSAFDLGSIDDI